MPLAMTTADASVTQFLLVMKLALVGLLLVVIVLLMRARGRDRAAKSRGFPNPLARLVYLALVVAIVALACTSFISLWRSQGMHGWWLMAHMMSAGVYLAAVTATALFLSRRLIGTHPAVGISYTLLLVLSIGVMGTILLSMLPVFGTESMRSLIDLHRYAGLGLLVVTVLHGVLRITS